MSATLGVILIGSKSPIRSPSRSSVIRRVKLTELLGNELPTRTIDPIVIRPPSAFSLRPDTSQTANFFRPAKEKGHGDTVP